MIQYPSAWYITDKDRAVDEPLTTREQVVMELRKEGRTWREVAAAYNMSVEQIRTIRRRIQRKTGVMPR